MKTVHNFIDGSFLEPISQKYIDSYNPSTGKVHAKVPDSDERDVNKAVESAKKAFSDWSGRSPQSRYYRN